MKIVINNCFGGFGLSDAAYEKLIEWGIPVRAYVFESSDDGEAIFDRTLEPASETKKRMMLCHGRYWETWLNYNRAHPLLVRVVEELGEQANGQFAQLRIVDVPNDVEWGISEYDGMEHVVDEHRVRFLESGRH